MSSSDSATYSIVGSLTIVGIICFLVCCCIRRLCCQRTVTSSAYIVVPPRRIDPPPQPQQVIVQNYAPPPYAVQNYPGPQGPQKSFQPVTQLHAPELPLGPQYHPVHQEFQQFPNTGQHHNPACAPSPYGPPPMS